MRFTNRFSFLILGLLFSTSCSPERAEQPSPSSSSVIAELPTPAHLSPSPSTSNSFPQKPPRFQREWGPPIAGLSGRKRVLLEREGVTVIEPTPEEYLNPVGTWNGKDVVLSFRYQGKLYQKLGNVPGLSEEFRGGRAPQAEQIIKAAWYGYLERL